MTNKMLWEVSRKLFQVKNMPTSITNKWLMEINLLFIFFSVFIGADHPTLTLEQKSGRLGDANQAYLWASPYQLQNKH